MAGMFYSLQEVAKKLNKSEEQVKQIIREGRLREFRDGPNLLFKVNEVEALISEINAMASKETPPEVMPEAAEGEISLASETAEGPAEIDLTGADTALSGEEINVLGEMDSEYELMEDTVGETKAQPGEGLPEEDSMGETTAASEEALLEEDTIGGTKAQSDEALLKDETMGETKAQSAEGLLEDDTMGATKTPPGEASLEAIEEDVNLDTFGSGSGLLDLSLQADDTSLGGILDEIYAPESERKKEPVEAGTAADVTATAEQMLSETLQPGLEAPAAIQMAVEPEPDTLSNAFGIMLFLPLLAIVYTALVAITGFGGAMPAILGTIQGIIWYVMIGIAVVAVLIVGVAFMLSGQAGKSTRKKKKALQPAPEDQTA